MIEQPADPAHDRKAEAIALLAAAEIGQPAELLEYLVELVLRNADAGIDDLQLDMAAAPPRAEQDSAARACSGRHWSENSAAAGAAAGHLC